MTCPAVKRYGPGKHLYVVVYCRPWRRRFRRTRVLMCWQCDLRIEEP